jgi:protein-S-isoprenylcysteine O-methyltransferase Ste14
MKKIPKYVPPFWMIPCLLIMVILHFFFPVYLYLQAPWNYLGLIPLLLSLVLAGAAAKLLARLGTTIAPSGTPEKLVTSGLYRFTRNPMYLGMTMIMLGIAMLLGSLSSLLPVALYMLIIEKLFISNEEKILSEIFGNDYEIFCNKVGRWF